MVTYLSSKYSADACRRSLNEFLVWSMRRCMQCCYKFDEGPLNAAESALFVSYAGAIM